MRNYRSLINCDLGEKDHPSELMLEKQLLNYVQLANIACGGHAGTAEVMKEMLYSCKENEVLVGAHPGYPDRPNFGRISLPSTPQQVQQWVLEQLGLIAQIARQTDLKLYHIKAHGALYHDVMYQKDVTYAFLHALDVFLSDQADICAENELKVVGLPGSLLEAFCKEQHIPFLVEAFADRKYEDDGSLMSRKKEGSVLDVASALVQCEQMLNLKEVTTASDMTLKIPFDTICIHGDSPDALAIAKKLSEMNTI